jgi:NADH:ubiquinone oxidoreductase subunit 6 (subunit J)
MILLLAGLVVSAMVCIIIRDILKASIALAVVSAILSIIMFLLSAPLAAVFELSVCAGLITVVFISAISMTRIRSKEETSQMEKERRKRFVLLPVILIVLLAGALFAIWPHLDALIPFKASPLGTATEQNFFWNKRQVDLVGQIIIILAGVYGVLIFFKERDVK